MDSILLPGEKLEPFGSGNQVIVSDVHHFSTDTILLADFSMPKKGSRCAEFGTGCGLISLLWCQKSAPKKVWAIDFQEDACSQARRSAALNHFSEMSVLSLDLRKISELPAKELPLPLNLDLVACNPPYQPTDAGQHNQIQGKTSARHETGCTFREVASAASRLLRWGGRFCCCLPPRRLAESFSVLQNVGLEPKKMRLVQHRSQNPPFLFLLESRRGGNSGMELLPTLILETENGSCSPEMLRIYGDYKSGCSKDQAASLSSIKQQGGPV